jgi:hypothetical protein
VVAYQTPFKPKKVTFRSHPPIVGTPPATSKHGILFLGHSMGEEEVNLFERAVGFFALLIYKSNEYASFVVGHGAIIMLAVLPSKSPTNTLDLILNI